MPIELADLIEQQSGCDSAADIELENLNDIIFEDDSLSERQYMQNIFICWFNFDLSINQYPSVCNSVITFVLWTYTCRPMFLWMIIYTLD